MSPGGAHEEQTLYWRKALSGAPTKLELPIDNPRPAIQSQRCSTETFELPSHLLEQLKLVGEAEQATLFMTLAAGFVILLNRYTGQDDLLVASPLHDEGMFGSVFNTIVLRTQIADPLDVRSLLRLVREQTLSAHAHWDLPFERLVAEFVPTPDPSHAPLCQAMFVLDDGEVLPPAPQYDLTLTVSETASGLRGSVAYATDLFEVDTIERLCGHYGAILEAIARDPSQSVRTLPMLTERERAQVIGEWNDTRADYPETCAHRLFEEQVARTPDATAIVFEGRQLSYRELSRRANQVAHYLRRHGVGPEVLVGVCIERSEELVVALLGVWKAGGAYVPLDPSLPKERLEFMLGDAAAKILLTDAKHRPLFAPTQRSFSSASYDTFCIDSEWARFENESTGELDSGVSPSSLAYVMYTSGSTGQPKGVMVLHRGLLNYLSWAAKHYAPDSGAAVPVHSSIAFDLTVTALYTPLVVGGRIEMLREDAGGQNLVAALRSARGRSLVKITPAHLALLSEQLGPESVEGGTKLFVIGGENLLAESLVLWREHSPATRLINEYGPTETVVGCSVYEVRADDPRTGSVPIGRPIANTQLYVLDRYMNPLPPGIVGELYIGGAGVARGYLNQAQLTKEKFVADPFAKERGARLYKTGDLCRYRRDGVLEYIGRVDDQVKIRGYRIELGEIESKLADLPTVQSCAVLAREDMPGNKQLVAYVVPRQDKRLTVEELRRSLRSSLPEYMVPAQFVFLDSLPLTTNGKVDRKALRAQSGASALTDEERVAPRTPTEERLVAIWQEMLGAKNVGINDNFFDLGGVSLLAIKTVARIQEAFRVDLSPQALFDDPTIVGLARIVSELSGITNAPGAGAKATAPGRSGPCFFGEPQLFGVYHPPQCEPMRDTALLVCPSIGHEHTRGYRAVQLLCEAAARAGFPALRFDYTGVGDSAGALEDGGVDVWCNDVLRALDELLVRSGARGAHIVGFRLGSALALTAMRRAGSTKARPVKSLCLWDPLLGGGEFLQLANGFQDTFLRDSTLVSDELLRKRAHEGQYDGMLLGYSFTESTQRNLVDLEVRSVEAWPSVPVYTVLSERSPGWEELATRLVSARRPVEPVEWELVTGAEGAWEDYASHEKTLRAGPVISRIVARLAGSER